MGLSFQAILPGPLDAGAYQREMQQTLERLAGGILHDFLKTTETWVEKPDFEIDGDPAGNNGRFMDIHVFCDALLHGDRVKGTNYPNPAPINLVYYFLNEGTQVRYATMTQDFRPKTRVRTLQSFPGEGDVAYVNIWVPRPGIAGRFWDQEIKKKYDRIIVSQLSSALIRAGRASGYVYVRGTP